MLLLDGSIYILNHSKWLYTTIKNFAYVFKVIFILFCAHRFSQLKALTNDVIAIWFSSAGSCCWFWVLWASYCWTFSWTCSHSSSEREIFTYCGFIQFFWEEHATTRSSSARCVPYYRCHWDSWTSTVYQVLFWYTSLLLGAFTAILPFLMLLCSFQFCVTNVLR